MDNPYTTETVTVNGAPYSSVQQDILAGSKIKVVAESDSNNKVTNIIVKDRSENLIGTFTENGFGGYVEFETVESETYTITVETTSTDSCVIVPEIEGIEKIEVFVDGRLHDLLEGIERGKEVTVVITPKENYYITECGVDTKARAATNVTYEEGVATFAFETADSATEYKVTAIAKTPIIAAKQGDALETINVAYVIEMLNPVDPENPAVTKDDIDSRIWNAAFTAVSEEISVEKNNVTILYSGGKYNVAEIAKTLGVDIVAILGNNLAKNLLGEETVAYILSDQEIWLPVDQKVEMQVAENMNKIRELIKPLKNIPIIGESSYNSINNILVNVETEINKTVHSFGDGASLDNTVTELIKAVYAGGVEPYGATEAVNTITVIDNRIVTEIRANESIEIVYGSYLTDDVLRDMLLDGEGMGLYTVATDTTAAVKLPQEYQDRLMIKFTGTDTLVGENVGEYIVTIEFPNTDLNYAGSNVSGKVIVTKADSVITVTQNNVVKKANVGNLTWSDLVNVQPGEEVVIPNAKVKNVPFVVGVNVLEGTAIANIDLGDILGAVNDNFEITVDLDELVDTLTSLQIDLNNEVANQIVDILVEIEKTLNVQVEVKLSAYADRNKLVPQDHGVYVVGAVTADDNYNLNANATYLIVAAEPVGVEFVDANSNNARIFTYTGDTDADRKEMTAYAFALNDEAKTPINGHMGYRYFGMQSDGTLYNSNQAPYHTGTYTVIALYRDNLEAPEKIGMAIGALVIAPASANVAVDNKLHTYDGSTVDVMDMITKNPEDAKLAVIIAGLDVSGDFSENGLSAVEGVVNVDFPARADEVLKQILPSAYADGITINSFINKLDEVKSGLETVGIDTTYVDTLIDTLNQLPDSVALTFKEQADVNPANIGAYLVGAVVFDPNYIPEAGLGVLMIVPEITEAELEWNYDDVNGIITYPILDSVDMGASALVAGVKDEGITAMVRYFFIGIDEDGNAVMTDDVSELGNGVYTQFAFIYDEISASLVIAEPIERQFIVVPQTVTVDFVDLNENDMRLFTYDGTPKAMDVMVKDMAGNVISQELLDRYLTVTYIGADVQNGAYKSTTPPTEIGAYTVIAAYVEYDDKGELVRAGMDIGAMVIEAKASGFGVDDMSLTYDGQEHLEEAIVNANDLDYIAVILDENNQVNVILPESWEVKTKTYDVSEGMNAVIARLQEVSAGIESAKLRALIAELENVLSEIDIRTLTLNGEKPVNAGEYQVIGLAYGENYKVAVDTGLLTITQRGIHIIIDNQTKIYGEADPELTFHLGAGDIIAGDEVSFEMLLDRADGENVGEYEIYTVNSGVVLAIDSQWNTNYCLADITSGKLTITKKAATITTDALSKYVGDQDPEITFTLEGFLEADKDKVTVSRLTGESAGIYEYQYDMDESVKGNYEVTFVNTNKFTILAKQEENPGGGETGGGETGGGESGGDNTGETTEGGNSDNNGGSNTDSGTNEDTPTNNVPVQETVPVTGDSSQTVKYSMLLLLAAGFLVMTLVGKRNMKMK